MTHVIDIHLTDSFPVHAGKCSHGGPSDVYRGFPATGGINKETSDPGLSPHHHLHTEAGRAAVQATADFLVGRGEFWTPRSEFYDIWMLVNIQNCTKTVYNILFQHFFNDI